MSETDSVRRNLPGQVAAARLRADGVFRRFFRAHTISAAGSTVSLVVLPILMFQRIGSALLTASLDAVYIAPYVLLGVFAGVLGDRVDRRRLMIGCEFGRTIALVSSPLAAELGAPDHRARVRGHHHRRDHARRLRRRAVRRPAGVVRSRATRARDVRARLSGHCVGDGRHRGSP